jgi:hypothetical protein
MKTKEQKFARIAALFAVSNLGHFHNIKVERYIQDDRSWTGDAYSEVCSIAGHLMETEEHEEYFTGEAEMWSNDLREFETIGAIAMQWPYHNDWLMAIDAIPEGGG